MERTSTLDRNSANCSARIDSLGGVMTAFIVPPVPKQARIPVITAEELANALRAYIPTVYPFSYIGEDITGERDFGTTLHFYGNNLAVGGGRLTVEARIGGTKVLRSWQGKLYNMPFDVSLYPKYGRAPGPERHLLIKPLADRSISIRHILRWDNGRAVLED
jgi:hypothetical protein